jgi:glyoxylate carboligase
MALMKAAMAAVLVMEKEGITTAFGVPGAAINPLYAQLRERQSITHILARHVEGAYTWLKAIPVLRLAILVFASVRLAPLVLT